MLPVHSHQALLQVCLQTYLTCTTGVVSSSYLPHGACLCTSCIVTAGYRVHQDKLDGYRFQYPQAWTPVTVSLQALHMNRCSCEQHQTNFCFIQTSGNDIFYRNPYDVNECLFVNLSSPSSSKYKSVRSIGTPDVVAEKARRQYLRDMMSTRLGVKRETNVVSASDRTGPDGNEYYDLQVTPCASTTE